MITLNLPNTSIIGLKQSLTQKETGRKMSSIASTRIPVTYPHSKLNHDMQKLLATISTRVLAKVSTFMFLVPAIHTRMVVSRGSRVLVSSSTAAAQ